MRPVKEYRTIGQIAGPLVFVRNVRRAAFGALVDILLEDGSARRGQVIDASLDYCVIQVFEETMGLDIETTRIRFAEDEALVDVSQTTLGRAMNGIGQPIDGLPPPLPESRVPVVGYPINPDAREEPTEFIQIGISTVDGMNTLVRGQKLPIFSGAGLPAPRSRQTWSPSPPSTIWSAG